MSTKVERALTRHVRPEPPAAGAARIALELEAIEDQLAELDALGRDLAEMEETLEHARARIEEWTP